MHVRKALASDAIRMTKLDRICFPKNIAYSRLLFDDLLECCAKWSFVAEDESGELAGFVIGVMTSKKWAHMITIDVHPDHRRKSLGADLMRLAEKELYGEGAKRIFLEVMETDQGALSFYESLGYSSIAIQKHYYGKGKHAKVLMKRLEAGFEHQARLC